MVEAVHRLEIDTEELQDDQADDPSNDEYTALLPTLGVLRLLILRLARATSQGKCAGERDGLCGHPVFSGGPCEYRTHDLRI